MATRFLLVQLADMGDLILTTPALYALRHAQPDAHLTLLANAKATPMIEKGMVDEVIALNRNAMNQSTSLLNKEALSQLWQLGNEPYDVVIFFHHFTLRLGTLKFWAIAKRSGASVIAGLDNGNGWFLTHSIEDGGFGAKHQAQYWLDLVGLFDADTSPERTRVGFDNGVLPITAHQGKRIIIHAGGGGYSLARRWEPEKFARVADQLHEKYNAQIVLIGTPTDDGDKVAQAMTAPFINLTGKTTLTQLTDILRSADLYIGTDSGVTHLATAVGVPILALFGPSNVDAWSPWSPNGRVIILNNAMLCAPCSYVGHGIGAKNGCEARTCMRLIDEARVMKASKALLEDEPLDAFKVEKFEPKNAFNDRLQILGLPVDRITYTKWMNLIDKWVKTGDRCHHVCTVNPEFMMIAQKDKVFAHILQRADLSVPDGVGLLLAARMLGTTIPQRVTGSDGTVMIAETANKKGWKLFLLGAAEGIADQAADVMREHLSDIQIVGTYSGSPSPDEEDDIIQRVNASGADILLVAYGAPKQDKWIARNLPRLEVKMAMGIGGSLDFIAGIVPRAPEWMREYGLEWLFRLYKQPWRIVRMMRLPRFVIAVLLRGEK